MKKLLLVTALGTVAQAHVGNPDIYLEGQAGPYRLFITVRRPAVIPGIARLEIHAETPGVREIRAVPLPMAGPGAKFAPVPDTLAVSKQDPRFFTGSLWMMATGSWQVRITVEGAQGEGTLAVPVPSAATLTKKMQSRLGALLFVLMILLIAGAAAMIGASVREAKLPPGVAPDAQNRQKGRIAAAVAFFALIGTACAGGLWWQNDAAAYDKRVYKPLQMKPAVDSSGVLTLKITDPGWLKPRPNSFRQPFFVRKLDDFVPDHNHLMHLYAIRQPGLDVVYHLHPDQIATGVFQLRLPSMPRGAYALYADIVHANGFPETLVSKVDIPGIEGRPLTGDDAAAAGPPWNQTSMSTSFALPDGYRMEWRRGADALRANQPVPLCFRLLKPDGSPPTDMQLYMGMAGHAAIVKTDGTSFAHIHPTGSVSMAAMMMAQPEMDMSDAPVPNEVTFPYGFPAPGRYRIFVQMKHGSTVETGIFDAEVD